MNIEVQRLAIAKRCGWKNIGPKQPSFGLDEDPHTNIPDGTLVGYYKTSDQLGRIPFYLESYSGMQEAIETLYKPQFEKFISRLFYITNADLRPKEEQMGAVFMATPEQRAEAFLKTVGEWED